MFRWDHSSSAFRGFSALELSDDGVEMLAVSDIGLTVRARLRRLEGRIVGIEADWPWALFAPDGTLKRDIRNDAEGLAGDPDGPFYLSLERNHRVVRHAYRTAPEETLPGVREFNGFPPNEGLEALAIDGEGRLLALAQKPTGHPPSFPVFRFDGTRWDVPFRIPAEGGYDTVGADVGPDGALYVLERRYRRLAGIRMRVRRVALAPPHEAETLLERWTAYRNFEGLAVWTDPAGHTMLTMISDDDSHALLGTWIAEFRVDE